MSFRGVFMNSIDVIKDIYNNIVTTTVTTGSTKWSSYNYKFGSSKLSKSVVLHCYKWYKVNRLY